jgi:hypothetical protein
MSRAAELLYHALDTPFGIVVSVDRPETLKNQLYQEIYKTPLFKDIGIVVKLGGEIWIIRKDKYETPDGEPSNDLGLEVDVEEIT